MQTLLLLLASNLFMTVAWYWHLKHKDIALWKVILISWLIAFVEYCIAVPANRIGSNNGLSGAQLKILQEAVTLIVFVGFAVAYLGEKPKWNHVVAFALILAAVAFAYYDKWTDRPTPPAHAAQSTAPAALTEVAETAEPATR